MNRNKNKWMIMGMVGLFVLLWGAKLGFGYIYGNGAGNGYGPWDGKSALGDLTSINQNIVIAANHYLKANADVQTFLSLVEVQDMEGVDFIELQKVVERAINNLEIATTTYHNLLSQALATPYNGLVIERLTQFDYENFKLKYGLFGDIFRKVGVYLSKGDINGVFNEILGNCTGMLKILTTIRKELQQYRLPEISLCWQINENFAASSLFGSYVARVFLTSN